jgi:hypothetical protein
MPLYALVADLRVRVTPDGPKRALCPECRWPVRANRGEVKVWYWSHQPGNPSDCTAAGETEWHLRWKAEAIDGTQERTVGSHRADVLAPGGYAVELQRSPIERAELRRREADWNTQGGMVWIFYAIEAAEEGRLRSGPSLMWPRASEDGQVDEITWSHAPDRVRSATPPLFLDAGKSRLLFVGGWRRGASPLTGWGWRVTKQWVINNVLRGDKIPEPFGEDPEEVIRRHRQEEAERLRAERARRDAELGRIEAEKRVRAEFDLLLAQAAKGLERLAFARRYNATAPAAGEAVASLFRWRRLLGRKRNGTAAIFENDPPCRGEPSAPAPERRAR